MSTNKTDFAAIAAQYVPEGYTIEYRKSLTGRHFGTRKLIQAPRPTTPASLYIFLHECGHAHLRHSHNGRTPRHVEEMEAEQWAQDIMARRLFEGSGTPCLPECPALPAAAPYTRFRGWRCPRKVRAGAQTRPRAS
jgi:hypothetical protein